MAGPEAAAVLAIWLVTIRPIWLISHVADHRGGHRAEALEPFVDSPQWAKADLVAPDGDHQHRRLREHAQRGADAEHQQLGVTHLDRIHRQLSRRRQVGAQGGDRDDVVEHRRPGRRPEYVAGVEDCHEHRGEAVEDHLGQEQVGERDGQRARSPAGCGPASAAPAGARPRPTAVSRPAARWWPASPGGARRPHRRRRRRCSARASTGTKIAVNVASSTSAATRFGSWLATVNALDSAAPRIAASSTIRAKPVTRLTRVASAMPHDRDTSAASESSGRGCGEAPCAGTWPVGGSGPVGGPGLRWTPRGGMARLMRSARRPAGPDDRGRRGRAVRGSGATAVVPPAPPARRPRSS